MSIFWLLLCCGCCELQVRERRNINVYKLERTMVASIIGNLHKRIPRAGPFLSRPARSGNAGLRLEHASASILCRHNRTMPHCWT